MLFLYFTDNILISLFLQKSNKKRNLPTSEIAKQQAWKDYWCSEGFNIVKKVFSEDYKLEIPDNGTNVQLLIFHNTSVEHLSFKPSSSLSARDNINFDASIDKSQKWISVWKLCCEEQTKRCYDLFMENYEKWSTIDASSIHRLAHLELMKLRSDHCAVLYADCDGGDSEDKVLKNDVALCD